MEGFNLGGNCYTTEAHISHRVPRKVTDLQDGGLHLILVLKAKDLDFTPHSLAWPVWTFGKPLSGRSLLSNWPMFLLLETIILPAFSCKCEQQCSCVNREGRNEAGCGDSYSSYQHSGGWSLKTVANLRHPGLHCETLSSEGTHVVSSPNQLPVISVSGISWPPWAPGMHTV